MHFILFSPLTGLCRGPRHSLWGHLTCAGPPGHPGQRRWTCATCAGRKGLECCRHPVVDTHRLQVEGSDAWKVVGANGAHRASPVSASMTDVVDDVSADPVGSQESVVVDEQQTDLGAV